MTTPHGSKKEIWMDFLAVSESDYFAAQTLYRSKKYPQAIFFLQQSAEKSTKAFALWMQIVTEKELVDSIGHDSRKIYRKVALQQKKRGEETQRLLYENPRLKLVRAFQEVEFDKELELINEYLSWLLSSKADVSYSEICAGLDDIYVIRREALKGVKEMRKLRFTDKMVGGANDAMQEVLEDFQTAGLIPKEKNAQPIPKQVWRFILQVQVIPGLYASCYNAAALLLAAVTAPHVTAVRYPSPMIPTRRYTIKHPVVRAFPELLRLQREALTDLHELDAFFKQMKRVKLPTPL